MISSNALTYALRPPSWHAIEFANPTLNAVAIAAAMTLISYQLTAILFDLVLGFKRKWAARASHLHILLLTRKATPLVIAANLLRANALTRLYYAPDLPRDTAVARHPARVPAATAAVLLFLLAVAPLINVASIFLTLERQRVLTFDHAAFGGVAFGLNKDLSVTKQEPLTELCVRLPVLARPGDTPLAEFSLCKLPWTGLRESTSRGLVSVSLADAHQILIAVQLGLYSAEVYKTAHLYANGTSWVIKPDISQESVEGLVDNAMKLVAKECKSNEQPVDTYQEFLEPGRENVMAKSIPCNIQGDTWAKCASILGFVEQHLTLIDAPLLEVATKPIELTPAQFFRGEQMQFIQRRKLYVGVAVLWVIAAVTVVLRVATSILWNNDVAEGIERIVKEKLKVGCCSSLLKVEDRRVVFNNKYQVGKYAHYGIGSSAGPIVNRFDCGIVGTLDLSKRLDEDSASESETWHNDGC